MEMSKNDDYTTCNLLCFSYLSILEQIYRDNSIIPQEINFSEKLEENDAATMFEKLQKTILNFSLDSLIVTEQCK